MPVGLAADYSISMEKRNIFGKNNIVCYISIFQHSNGEQKSLLVTFFSRWYIYFNHCSWTWMPKFEQQSFVMWPALK